MKGNAVRIAPQVVVPRCSADITSPEAIKYRRRDTTRANTAAFYVRQRAKKKAGRPFQCTSTATYKIDGAPYCVKHAGGVALQILVERTK